MALVFFPATSSSAQEAELQKQDGLLIVKSEFGLSNPTLELDMGNKKLGLEFPESIKSKLLAFHNKAVTIYYSKITIHSGVVGVEKIEIPVTQSKIEGIFKTGIMAIGGETLGNIIEVSPAESYEVIMDSSLLESLKNGPGNQKVVAYGLKTSLKGIERPNRPALIVEAIEKISQ